MNPDAVVTPEPTHVKLESRTALEEAIDRVLPLARRQLAVFDKTFGTEWNQPTRVDLVRRFCLNSRRNQMRIVLHDPHPLYRACPRLLALLRQFSHVIAIHESQDQAKNVYDPFVLVDDRHYMHRFHYDGAQGILGIDDPLGARALRDRFEEIWAASDPSVPATTLGL
ncbi:MAG: hypothetical protein ABI794_12940 [Betaproteobacteria bacterium]